MAVSASFPNGYITYSTKQDGIDFVDDDHINQLQAEQVAMQGSIGTLPEGNKATLAERIGVMIATDGTLAQSDGYPGSPSEGQMFWRRDLFTASVYSSIDASWHVLGQSLSNVIYEWHGSVYKAASNSGLLSTNALSPNASSFDARYQFFVQRASSFQTMLDGVFFKLTGQNNITTHAITWGETTANRGIVGIDIGGITGTLRGAASTNPMWEGTSTLDVSGLSVGTHRIIIQLKSASSGNAFLGAITMIAS